MPSWRGALGSAAVCAAIYTAPAFAQSAGSITAAQASEHVGDTRTVCGTVVSPKFGTPEVKYRDKRICATGLIKLYRGTPEIIATESSQIVESQ